MSVKPGKCVMNEFLFRITDLLYHSNTFIVLSVIYFAMTENLPAASYLTALRLSTLIFTVMSRLRATIVSPPSYFQSQPCPAVNAAKTWGYRVPSRVAQLCSSSTPFHSYALNNCISFWFSFLPVCFVLDFFVFIFVFDVYYLCSCFLLCWLISYNSF